MTGRSGAACLNRLRAALLERRIIDERVRPRVDDVVREDRGLRRVARDARDLTSMNARENILELREIHCFLEAVAHSLVDQWMIRKPTVPRNVLEACGSI